MFTREGITQDVQTVVKNLLEENGFVHDVTSEWNKYEKKYDWGHDYCFLPHVRFLPKHISFNITVHRRIDMIEEVWQEWADLINVSVENPNDISTLYVTEKNAYPEIVNEKYYDGHGAFIFKISDEGLSNIKVIIDNVFNDKILLKLNEFRDLKSIDKLINSDLDAPQNIGEIFNVDGGFMFRRMAIAKITNNNIYEKICDLYKSRFSKIVEIAKNPDKEYFLNYPIIFEKVYERLKSIEPLKNTILPGKTT